MIFNIIIEFLVLVFLFNLFGFLYLLIKRSYKEMKYNKAKTKFEEVLNY